MADTKARLKELMKQGPPLTVVADKLGISRPTLYRHMDSYMNGDDDSINPNLREYFNNIIMGKYKTKDEALAELEQIRFFLDAEKTVKKEEFDKEWREYEEDCHSFRYGARNLSADEKVKRQAELDRRERELEDKAKKLEIDFRRYLFDEDPQDVKWNDGEIRSACLCPFDGTMVLIDADFDRCRDITVEVMIKVSGEDFVMARVKPEENRRFAVIDFLRENVAYKYRLKWNDGDRVKYTPAYDIKFKAY